MLNFNYGKLGEDAKIIYAPTQVKILPIGNEHIDYAYALKQQMTAAGLRIEVDDRNETIGRKIREAQLDKVPYMLVIGDKEMNEKIIAVRSRKDGDIGTMTVEDFIAKCLDDVKNLVK